MKKAPTISIDAGSCTRCGRCITVCPARVLRLDAPSRQVQAERMWQCISCGQCAAICPTGALHHSAFPPDTLRPLRRDVLPRPDQVLALLQGRRSCRTFTSTPLTAAEWRPIIEAARSAPTASNTQEVRMSLVISTEQLHALTAFTAQTFGHTARRLNAFWQKPLLRLFRPEALRHASLLLRVAASCRAGRDPVVRQAPAVLLFYTPEASLFGPTDAQLAYQNASIMAESMGVGQLYLGYLCSAIRLDKGALERQLGIKGTIQAAMALGHPRLRFGQRIVRPVSRIKVL